MKKTIGVFIILLSIMAYVVGKSTIGRYAQSLEFLGLVGMCFPVLYIGFQIVLGRSKTE